MKMHNPPHPGEVLRELCLRPLGLDVTQAATALGVSRKTLSTILNGRAGISPEMAIRWSMAFNTSSESWLNQQVHRRLVAGGAEPEEAPRPETRRGLTLPWVLTAAMLMTQIVVVLPIPAGIRSTSACLVNVFLTGSVALWHLMSHCEGDWPSSDTAAWSSASVPRDWDDPLCADPIYASR